MGRILVVATCVLVAACTAERAPAPPSLQDLDAALGDGSVPPFGAVGAGGPPTPRPMTEPECHARVLVIFDRSGSMNELWETSDAELPRWTVASEALVAALTPLAANLSVGAILFPSGPNPELGVCAPVDPIERQLDYSDGDAFLDVWERLWSYTEVEGSTPLDIAFDRADEALPDDGVVTAVVVLTDGAPTCSGPVPAWERAYSWNERGITTWVVGLPGARGVDVLDRIAAEGGSGSRLDVDDPAALTSALRSIVGGAVEQACL